MNIYYVYTLTDPRTNNLFYVGKGKHKRYLVHERIVLNGRKAVNLKLHNKISKILANGNKIIYDFIAIGMSSDDAYQLEQKTIDAIGLDNLCNLKNGGTNGATFTEEVKLRMSVAAKNKNYAIAYSKERNAKISRSKTGVPCSSETKQKLSNFWTTHSMKEVIGEEAELKRLKKISEANTGKTRSIEFVEKQRAAVIGELNPMYGTRHTDEWKTSQSDKLRKWYTYNSKGPMSDETKKKLSDSIKLVKEKNPPQKHSEETKRLQSEKRKLYWANKKNIK